MSSNYNSLISAAESRCNSYAQKAAYSDSLSCLPVGAIIGFYTNNAGTNGTITNNYSDSYGYSGIISSRYLLCDGSTVSTSTSYKRLRTTMGVTQVPSLNQTGIFIGGGSSAGSFLSASAPNITGAIQIGSRAWDGYWDQGGISTVIPAKNGAGCFSGNGVNCNDMYSGSDNSRIFFSANRSSGIYGRSSYLYPNHYTVKYYIKYR